MNFRLALPAHAPRQQLPPQIKKIKVTDRKSGKSVVRYQVTVDAGENPQTRKRQQVRRRYATEKQARDALAEITQQVSTDAFVPRKAVTVEQLCDDWLASFHNARQTTINGYAYCLAALREQHGHLAGQKLTRQNLDKLLIALRDGGTKTAKCQTRRAWSPRSLNAAIDAWRLALAYGCGRRDLAHNVAASIKKVSRPRREMQTYTPEEIRLVLRAADKDRNGQLWYLALSGLRRGEIAGAKWSDIDLDARTITIARNRVQVGAATVVENEPKTQSSRRTLPLDAGLISVLKRASARYAQEKLTLGAAHADSGYVAVNEAGEPYTPGALTNMWHRPTTAAGARPIRLHDARHSCGTALHLRGVPMAVIAKWLGHADASITARIYAHSQDEELVSYVAQDNDGGPIAYPLGRDALGLIMYTTDGYMSAQIMHPGRPAFDRPDSDGGTPEQEAAAAAGYLAYSGPFEVDESTGVVHHDPTVSLLPNWLNGTQIRHSKLDGDHLTLSAVAAEPDGTEITSTLVWKRAPEHPTE